MEPYDREFFLYRIICGYMRYKNLRIYYPYGDILYEGTEVYRAAYEEAKANGLMEDNDAKNLLIEQNLWTEQREKELNEILPGHIDVWKKDLYRAYFRSDDRKKIREHLAVARNEYERLSNIRNRHYQNTCAGVANYARMQFFVEKLTYTDLNVPYDWEDNSSYMAIIAYQNSFSDENCVRELSRTSPWTSMWYAGKKGGSVFNKPAIELTTEQIRLISFSAMYDNVREHPECPSDELINDDDCLDGWMLVQKEDRDSKSAQRTAQSFLSRHSNADEVYVPAQTMEDARRISSLNSPQAQAIKRQRFQYLEKHGTIPDIMLPDMQQRLRTEVNRANIESMKGN